ncbi:hypothetical protein ACIQVO_36255 [Streptomyces sp. NPDC101062]|uniref:hypothetical protein n=1 Tax=unclassified Streptomyces TaxID=2593676 RepID=UPI0037F90F9C
MRHQLTGTALAHIALDANVRHVPAWLYVQNHGGGTVSFADSSRVPGGKARPLRYGSDRTHQFLVGELLVRPHYALDTNVLRGRGLGGLVTQHPDLGGFLDDGEILLNPHGLCPVTPR